MRGLAASLLLAAGMAVMAPAGAPAQDQDAAGSAAPRAAGAETQGPGRKITRFVPVPETISPEAQAVLAGPLSPYADVVPASPEAWKALIAEINASTWTNLIQPALARYPVTIERREIAGVPVAVVTPKSRLVKANNRRVILNIHGGAFIVNGGRQAVLEAIPIASLLRTRVIAVDYRMPPDHPFPAALDDTLAVYRTLIRGEDRRRVGVYGTSAGGNLVVAMLLQARAAGLPMPGAVGLVSPWSDIGPVGDSLGTNAVIDPTLVHYDGLLRAAAQLYAHGTSLRDPRVSPVLRQLRPLVPADAAAVGLARSSAQRHDAAAAAAGRSRRRDRDAAVRGDVARLPGQLWRAGSGGRLAAGRPLPRPPADPLRGSADPIPGTKLIAYSASLPKGADSTAAGAESAVICASRSSRR